MPDIVQMQREIDQLRAALSSLTVPNSITLGGFTMTVPATGTAALLGVSNTFTQQQNLPSAGISIYGGSGIVEAYGISLNPGNSFGINQFRGFFLVSNCTDDTTQLIICNAGGSFTNVAQQGLSCTLGSDSGSTIAIFISGTVFYVKNKYAVTKYVRVEYFGN